MQNHSIVGLLLLLINPVTSSGSSEYSAHYPYCQLGQIQPKRQDVTAGRCLSWVRVEVWWSPGSSCRSTSRLIWSKLFCKETGRAMLPKKTDIIM